jgi:predicted nucleotidyltransferase
MKLNGVEFDADKIADFCRRHGISRLSLFGSILRADFRPDSDVVYSSDFPRPRG